MASSKVEKATKTARKSKSRASAAVPSAATWEKAVVLLVTGTPGTGKSHLIKELLAAHPEVRSLNVSQLVRDERLFHEYDEHFDTCIINEKKTRRRLVKIINEHRESRIPLVIECHSCPLFQKAELSEGIDEVICLKCSTESLFDRLQARGYSPAKRTENIECEIMGICEEEAGECFCQSKIHVRENDNADQMKGTLSFIDKLVASSKV